MKVKESLEEQKRRLMHLEASPCIMDEFSKHCHSVAKSGIRFRCLCIEPFSAETQGNHLNGKRDS